jgi:pimeloyl-ACP methyl ester carboxylesterase
MKLSTAIRCVWLLGRVGEEACSADRGIQSGSGGPGHEGPRPTEASAWIKAAVNHFRVLLMDQRGTGLSAAITPASLVRRGTPEQQAEYLAHFRSAFGPVQARGT